MYSADADIPGGTGQMIQALKEDKIDVVRQSSHRNGGASTELNDRQ